MVSLENPKRKKILEIARKLFWKHGVRRISVDEICREADVSRMTFYKHFENKIDLAKAVMDEQARTAKEKADAIIESEMPFPEKVSQFVQLKFEQTEYLSSELYADLHLNAIPDLKEHFDKLYLENLQFTQQFFADAQKKGDVSPDIEPEFFSYILRKMLEMAHDEELIAMFKSPQRLILELTTFFFYGILPNPHVIKKENSVSRQNDRSEIPS